MIDENNKEVRDKTLLFKKDAMISHIQQLRGLAYACFTQIFKSETKQNVLECLQSSLKHLPQLVIKDVMLLPKILEESGETDDALEELNNEALELMMSLMTRTP